MAPNFLFKKENLGVMDEKEAKLNQLKKERQLLLDVANGCMSYNSCTGVGYKRLDIICDEIDVLENGKLQKEVNYSESIYPVAI